MVTLFRHYLVQPLKINTVLDIGYSFSQDYIHPTDDVNVFHLPMRPEDFALPLSQTRRKKTQKLIELPTL